MAGNLWLSNRHPSTGSQGKCYPDSVSYPVELWHDKQYTHPSGACFSLPKYRGSTTDGDTCNFLKIVYYGDTMASQENLVKMVNKATGYTYMTRKNRKKLAGVKLKLRKYDPVVRKVVEFTESKK
jgi:ribosomal protein L33